MYKYSLLLPKSGLVSVRPLSGMGKAKVFVTRSDFPKPGTDILKAKYDVEMWPIEKGKIPRSTLVEKVKGRDAIFVSLSDQVNKELLDAAGPNLKVVATMSVGVDHIELKAAKEKGIKIGYTPGVLTEAVAEISIGLLLATSRRFFESHKQIFNNGWKDWSPMWMCGPAIKGSTVGIVGLGRIGMSVAEKLVPFGVCKIYYTGTRAKPNDVGAEFVSFDKLLKESDFIIITCALTPETKNMFTEEKFKMMKNTAILINVSRGAVIDQNALVKALQEGTIRAAGLDVMTPEPLPPDHPLLKMDNCVIIPHIGSATYQARMAMSELTAKNIVAALEGSKMPAEYPV